MYDTKDLISSSRTFTSINTNKVEQGIRALLNTIRGDKAGIAVVIVVTCALVFIKGGGSKFSTLSLVSSFQNTNNIAHVVASESGDDFGVGNGPEAQDTIITNDNLLTTVQDTSLISHFSALPNAVEEVADTHYQNQNEVIEYEVTEGDNLSFIARDFNIDVQSIIWANDLTDADSIKPGTKLKIPPVKGVVHVIGNGDTLSELSSIYDVDVATILNFNNLTETNYLQIGDEVIVPGGKVPVRARVAYTNQENRFSHLPDSGGYLGVPVLGVKTQGIHGRNAVDIGAPCGTEVYASQEGRVTGGAHSGWSQGYGLYLEITHPNGIVTRYAHNSVNIVDIGDYVRKGQLIAKVGTTGKSTGCHSHFEVHGMGNPARFL